MFDFNDVNKLKEYGFTGLKTVQELWLVRSSIPKMMGVYMVINPSWNKPEYISPGVGGFFKGKDPNVLLKELKVHYVENAKVVYIGKAGGNTSKATLHSRIRQYLRFGQGKNVGHWGGRLIWQIKHHQDLVFCWKPTPDKDPRQIEKELLDIFSAQFQRMPFANLVR